MNEMIEKLKKHMAHVDWTLILLYIYISFYRLHPGKSPVVW